MAEQPTETVHSVRIEHDPESHAYANDCHVDCVATLLCPGVTSACRVWEECERCRKVLRRCTDAQAEEYDERLWEHGEAHGEEHQRLDGYWMTPTNRCMTVACEEDDANYLIPNLPDGEHPVDLEWEEGYLTVTLRSRPDRINGASE